MFQHELSLSLIDDNVFLVPSILEHKSIKKRTLPNDNEKHNELKY